MTGTDLAFVQAGTRPGAGRLLLAALLKTRRDLGYFPAPNTIHTGTMAHVAAQLGVAHSTAWPDEVRLTKSLCRYQAAVRTYLSVTAYDAAAEQMLVGTVLEAAEIMSDPANRINQAIEALQAAAIDLPAFRTLDRLVNRLRAEVHGRMYDRTAARFSPEHMTTLNTLLARPPGSVTIGFNRFKQAPGPATPTMVRLWTDRLAWLDGLIDPDPPLEGIAHTNLHQFAAEAAAAVVGDLLDIAQPGKRHTLLLALLRQARMRCRDELIEMLLRHVWRTQAAAKEQLAALHDQHRGIAENLIGIFGQVLGAEQGQDTNAEFGRQVRDLLSKQGGTAALAEQCGTVSALHRSNDLPLLWAIHTKHRVLLFRLFDVMDVQSATQDRSLLDALAVVSSQRHARRDEVRPPLTSASPPSASRRSSPSAGPSQARMTGVRWRCACSSTWSMPWDRRPVRRWLRNVRRLPRPAPALGRVRGAAAGRLRRSWLPRAGRGFATALRAELTTLAAAVDAGFPANIEFSVDFNGTPHLKQSASTEQLAELAEFEAEVRGRVELRGSPDMEERYLLDILKGTDH